MVATPEARDYKRDVSKLRPIVPDPPVVVIYRPHFKDRRRDAANICKVLIDSLYKQDKGVCPWCIPGEPDARHPHVELWFVELGRESNAKG
jgi:hypothetical protein